MDMSVSWRNHFITVVLAFVCGLLVGLCFSLSPTPAATTPAAPTPVKTEPTPATTQVTVLDLQCEIVDPPAEGTPQ